MWDRRMEICSMSDSSSEATASWARLIFSTAWVLNTWFKTVSEMISTTTIGTTTRPRKEV